MYTYIYIYVYTYTHTYMYMYTHTYIHIGIHLHQYDITSFVRECEKSYSVLHLRLKWRQEALGRL